MDDLYKEDSQKKNIVTTKLEPREVYYLRLLLHGYSSLEVCDFFNVKEGTLNKYKKSMKAKLYCKTDTEAIVEAFSLNILNKYDFVDQLIKDQAIVYTDIIWNRIHEPTEDKNKGIFTLGEIILEFYKKCEIDLRAKSNIFFNLKEKNYIELKFKGFSNSYIAKELKLLVADIKILEKNIFQKLQTYEWFNGIRKVFDCGILNREDCISLNISTEVLDCAVRTLAFQSFPNLTNKEKQLKIYYQLVDFYNTLEYNCLLKIKIA